MHELVHILGFSSGLYGYYQDANLNTKDASETVTQKSDGQYIIKSPTIMAVAD